MAAAAPTAAAAAGHIYSMGCGVLAQAVSNTTVSHNEIKHFSYTGVSLGWTWNYEPTSNGDNEVQLVVRAHSLTACMALS